MLRFTVVTVYETFAFKLPMSLVTLILVPILLVGWVSECLDPLSEDPL